MTAILNPYLSFKSDARDAMTFYHGVFGGEMNMMTFGDMNPAEPDATKNLIMHAMLTAPNGMVLMGADTPASMEYQPAAGISVSLSGPKADGPELRRYWQGLSAGGMVTIPLAVAPWGDEFGMCVDRFGIAWLVNIAGK